MKKKLTRLLVTLLVALNVMGAASALAAEVKEVEVLDSTVVTRAEETTWVYREYEGWLQKRQWSNTYGKWLTNWINVVRL